MILKALSGNVSTADVLRFAESFSVEDNVVVLREVLSNIMKISQLTLTTDYHRNVSSYIRKLLQPISRKLGWNAIPGESGLQSMCRTIVLKALGINGDEETINEAKTLFAKHLQGEIIPADLRAPVYAAVLVDADESTIDQIIEMHDACDLQEESLRLAQALGYVRNKELLPKILNFAISVSLQTVCRRKVFF